VTFQACECGAYGCSNSDTFEEVQKAVTTSTLPKHQLGSLASFAES